jgi:hypothetical protein
MDVTVVLLVSERQPVEPAVAVFSERAVQLSCRHIM